MYLKLGHIKIWPSRELVNETMPHDFKEKYLSTKVIIDCTEVQCEMPSSPLMDSELFSSYTCKHHTTLKALVGISPKRFLHLSVNFIQGAYQTGKWWSGVAS